MRRARLLLLERAELRRRHAWGCEEGRLWVRVHHRVHVVLGPQMLVGQCSLLPLHGLRVGVVLLSGGVEMAPDLAELALLAACFLRVALGLRL